MKNQVIIVIVICFCLLNDAAYSFNLTPPDDDNSCLLCPDDTYLVIKRKEENPRLRYKHPRMGIWSILSRKQQQQLRNQEEPFYKTIQTAEKFI